MARLSTHVLDTSRGVPAIGMAIDLYQLDGGARTLMMHAITNSAGRTADPLLSGETLAAGVYELVFHAAEYFRNFGIVLSSPPFLDEVVIRFGLSDAHANYHVP